MRVLSFLLDNVFFLLVAAALLRGWMNTARIRMTQQPGIFVMAITDWIVVPVRRVLPRRWVHANVDWGSVVAASLLALGYAAIWHLLMWGGLALAGLPWWLSVPVMALMFLLRTAIQGVMGLTLVFALLSWVQPMSPLYYQLGRLVDPLLKPIRRVVPTIGGVDLSALVLLIALQVVLLLLA